MVYLNTKLQQFINKHFMLIILTITRYQVFISSVSKFAVTFNKVRYLRRKCPSHLWVLSILVELWFHKTLNKDDIYIEIASKCIQQRNSKRKREQCHCEAKSHDFTYRTDFSILHSSDGLPLWPGSYIEYFLDVYAPVWNHLEP